MTIGKWFMSGSDIILAAGIGLTVIIAFLAYRYPRTVAWGATLGVAMLVALFYNFAKDDEQATQTTKVIADVDATLPTPGCPAERPIGLNIRNLSDKIVIGVSWRLLVTRKGATDNIADRSNKVKAFNRVMWPGANIEICAAMPKLTEPVTIAEAEIYPRLSHVRISSAPISKELSTLDKGFFPEDD